MKFIYAITLLLCCAAIPARAQKIICGDNYKRIVQDAEDAFKKGKYLDAYDRYNAARGCAEADIEFLEKRQFEVLQAADAAEDRAQFNLATAQKLVGHFNFGAEKAAWAYKDGYFGVINKKGDALSDFVYENPGDFHNGLAQAQVNSQFVFVGDDGKEMTDRYDNAIETGAGMWRMGKMGGATYGSYEADIDWLDTRGGKDGLRLYQQLVWSGLDNKYWIKQDSLWGLIDETGRMLLPYTYQEVRNFYENKAAVTFPLHTHPDFADKWGYINTNGEIVVQPAYENAYPFRQGKAIVFINGLSLQQLIDSNGKPLLKEACRHILRLNDGTTWVSKSDSTYQRLDKNENVILEAPFTHVEPFVRDKLKFGIKAMKTSSSGGEGDSTATKPIVEFLFEEILVGLAETSGKILLPARYHYLQPADDKHVWAGRDSILPTPGDGSSPYSRYWDLLDLQGRPVDSLRNLTNVEYIQNGFSLINTSRQLTDDGKLLINPEKKFRSDVYKDILYFGNKLWAERKPGKANGNARWDLLNLDGQPVYGASCNDLHYNGAHGPFYPVVKDNGRTWVDTFGRATTLDRYSLTKRKGFGKHVIRNLDNKEGVGDAFGRALLQPEFYEVVLLGSKTCLVRRKINVTITEGYEQGELVYDILHLDRMILEEAGFTFIDSIGDGLYTVGYGNRYSVFSPDGTPLPSLGLIDSTGKYILKPVRPDADPAQASLTIHDIQRIGPGVFVLKSITEKKGNPAAGIPLELQYRWGVIGADGREIQPRAFTNRPEKTGGHMLALLDGKWGWIDTRGRWTQLPRFDAARALCDSLVAVRENGRWGVMNFSGKYYLKAEYDSIGWYDQGLLDVKIGPQWAIVNLSGQPVLQGLSDPTTQTVLTPSLLRFLKGDKWGLKNIYTHQEVLPPLYDLIWLLPDFYYDGIDDVPFQREEKFFLARLGDMVGCFDARGNKIIPIENIYIDVLNRNLLQVMRGNDTSSNNVYLTNNKGEIIRNIRGAGFRSLGRQFILYSSFVNELQYWGLLDSMGREIVPPHADNIEIASEKEGYIWVFKNDEYTLLDKHGKKVPNMVFDFISLLDGMDETWEVRQKGRISILIFDKGPRIIAGNTPLETEKKFWSGNYYLAKNKSKYGVIDGKAREIIPCKYTSIAEIASGTWLTEVNSRYGLYSVQYGIDIPAQYEELGCPGEAFGWIRAKKNGKWGWIDRKGKVMIPFRYETASPFYEGRAMVEQPPYIHFFFINPKGEMIVGNQ